MEQLIEYRNNRKQEGADISELRLLDDKILSTMDQKNLMDQKHTVHPLDQKHMVHPLDQTHMVHPLDQTHMAHHLDQKHMKILNTNFLEKPKHIVHIRARVMPDKMYAAPVDLLSETVSDLKRKLGIAMECPAYTFRMIHKGYHLEDNNRPLSEINLSENDIIGICKRLVHNGEECCFVNYNMLCDAYARKTVEPLKGLDGRELRMLLAILGVVTCKDETTKMLANYYVNSDCSGLFNAAHTVLPDSPANSVVDSN